MEREGGSTSGEKTVERADACVEQRHGSITRQ